jgi:hypothetical protein
MERLDSLLRSGAIDDEFAELKRRVVWGDDSPAEKDDRTG